MNTKKTNAKIGIYISEENRISLNLGTSAFSSIIFSNPSPIETDKKI